MQHDSSQTTNVMSCTRVGACEINSVILSPPVLPGAFFGIYFVINEN